MRLPEVTTDTLAEERGLMPTTLKRAGIALSDHHPYEGWWQIPYPHHNGIWKYRYKNPDPHSRPKYRDEPGATFHLYNPSLLGPNEPEVWFAEGEFDTLALIECGIPAIGIHGVSNVSDPGEGRFKAEWTLLFEDSLAVVAFDNDEAALEPARRLAAALGGEIFDSWPTGVKDWNDWWRTDPSGMQETVTMFREALHRRTR